MITNNSVPILITWDVDPDLWLPAERRRWAFNTAMDICHERNIKASFYLTAHPANLHEKSFAKLQQQGHEIGCHGLTHGTEENYDRMSAAQQRLYIKMATEYLEAITGLTMRAFRSPRVKTSAITQRILAEHGYLSDSSVCSQRIDFISSNLINPGWLVAPRRPYHPHAENAYQRGNLPLWQLPVSAALMPFISSLLQASGLNFMKQFFRLLYQEARQTGKPIIYLAHPSEFIGGDGNKKKVRIKSYLKLKYFTPTHIRAHGFHLRSLLYRHSPNEVLEMTKELFTFMASFPDVQFMTATEYTRQLNL